MFTDSLCLSDNIDSKQIRCVDTKTQQIKDDLKVYLQGILEGKGSISNISTTYKDWLKELFFGRKKIDLTFFRFLIDLLSCENTAVPSSYSINKIYIAFVLFDEQNLSLNKIICIISNSDTITPDNTTEWQRIYSFISVISQNTISDPIELRNSYIRFVDNIELLFVEKNEHIFKIIKSKLLRSTYFIRLLVSANTNILDSSFDLISNGLDFNHESMKISKVSLEICNTIIKLALINNDDPEFITNTKKLTSRIGEFTYILNQYISAYTHRVKDLNIFISFILYSKNIRLIPYLKSLIQLVDKDNQFIDNAVFHIITQVIRIENIQIEKFDDMIEYLFILSEEHKYFYEIKFDHIFWIMEMYAKHEDLSINRFSDIDKITISKVNEYEFQKRFNHYNNRINSPYVDFHKKLINFLFFKYEKPALLINNINQNLYGVLEFLISSQRINKYPDLPIPFSNKETNYFYSCDVEFNCNSLNRFPYLTLNDILGYVKFRRKGVGIEICNRIIESGGFTNNYKYWGKAVSFFVNYRSELQEDFNAGELITFLINNQRFNIKQRTWNSMQRVIRNWYEQQRINSLKIEQDKSWLKIDISDFLIVIEDIEYTITQLNTAKELILAGDLQNNCLATYIDDCIKGVSSIWLLRKKIKDHYKILVTIEVVNNTVSQVKGKSNRASRTLESQIILIWAEKNNIRNISF